MALVQLVCLSIALPNGTRCHLGLQLIGYPETIACLLNSDGNTVRGVAMCLDRQANDRVRTSILWQREKRASGSPP